jgi:TonB family protein
MKKIILIFTILLLYFLSSSLNAQVLSQEPVLYLYVDKQPAFICSEGLKDYIYNHNLMWPIPQMDAEGTVLISFVIKKDGSVNNVKIEKGLHPAFDEEAKRVIESMPDWEPGEINSNKVDVKFYIPIVFGIKKFED